MTIYKISTDSGVMYASANLVQAASPIHIYFGDDPRYDERGETADAEGFSWQSTPYQTADARHRDNEMASLVAAYHEMGDVLTIEIV